MTNNELESLKKGDIVIVPPHVSCYAREYRAKVWCIQRFFSDIEAYLDYLEPTPDGQTRVSYSNMALLEMRREQGRR